MKLQNLALAVALTAASVGSAFAAERTVIHERPDGTTVVKHVERYDNDRADRYDHDRWEHRHHDRDVRVIRHERPRMERVKVVRRVVWTDHHGNRHIRKTITWRWVPTHTAERVVVRHYG